MEKNNGLGGCSRKYRKLEASKHTRDEDGAATMYAEEAAEETVQVRCRRGAAEKSN